MSVYYAYTSEPDGMPRVAQMTLALLVVLSLKLTSQSECTGLRERCARCEVASVLHEGSRGEAWEGVQTRFLS